MRRFKNLQTLFIQIYDHFITDALNEMFKVTRSIRLLQINDARLKVILEKIGYLHHLRYLRFHDNNAELLSRSLSSLYHLQFLKIERKRWLDCSDDYFPRDMNNLFNLRYLTGAKLNFSGIGKLKLLRELKLFYIKNENGYRVDELEHMNELRCLKIINLEDLRVAEDACNAKLCDKKKLTHLFLRWGDIYIDAVRRSIADPELDERVIDNLQPHNYLKKLHITDYMGARSYIWMNEAHTINNIEEIYLRGCLKVLELGNSSTIWATSLPQDFNAT